ncbi:hypothetical protein FB567DRAFT_515425 [Paraphoma chrysanthemicola]|uniref:Uncharacterized protein n=1 Tax=Paraphoma chrysanthemicola TaxID=798071 RepID=A0A8K0W485_9PLEO|nr:hypothetical protein FB567DRAFT_515425 [Paraphoma chrysanthemicola]
MYRPYHTFRSWTWEILSVLLAIGLVAAISAILVSHDGKPSPVWGTQLNLNALLAFLSTMLRALLVIIASQIICQQKWEWLSKKRLRPLSDLQKFDSASRSSLGALLLMPTVMLKDATSLIAVAVLAISFLIGPFVQQASRTTPCLFPATGLAASLPYAHYVPRRGGLSLGGIGEGAGAQGTIGDAIPDTAIAILSSITAPNGTENQIRGTCSTGTCTFRYSDQGESDSRDSLDDASSTHSTVAMCDKCTDISSLVSSHYNTTAQSKLFTLPNGFKLTYNSNTWDLAMIAPSKDLRWLGDLLSPELQAISRWAYVNTTFFTVKYTNTTIEKKECTAAVCVLYPCLRTYTASIIDNQLREEEISSQIMELSMPQVKPGASSEVTEIKNKLLDRWGTMSTQAQYEAHYAAVKSPCQVGSQVYDKNLNTTVLSNMTGLSLYDLSDSQRYTYRNISAPESCIYRHDVQFVRAISWFLNEEIFNGSCSWYKSISCRKAGNDNGTLSNLGSKALLETLIEGERDYSNVTAWFSAFARSMTNRFRFQYGGAAFDASLPLWADQKLPAGEVQGVAWQPETCVSAHRGWLLLPICLTVITTLLMLWTIISNWRSRHVRPVWKDNILPLLFYRHSLNSDKPGGLPWNPDNITEMEDRTRMMETKELEKTGDRILITLNWSANEKSRDLLGKGDASAITLQDVESVPVQRISHEADSEVLLTSSRTAHTDARRTSY